MDNTLSRTKKLYYYPPCRDIVPKATAPGAKEIPGHNQLYRQTGPVPKHKFSPEPWPKKRFHQGEPKDLFVLKGGTSNYSDVPKIIKDVPDKDVATFFGQTKGSYRHIGEKTKFGENVMKFYGDGSALDDKRERMQETIAEAKSKFNFMTPDQPQRITMRTLARKTLKQERQDFGKITLSYQEARAQIYGGQTRKIQSNAVSKRVNLFTRGS